MTFDEAKANLTGTRPVSPSKMHQSIQVILNNTEYDKQVMIQAADKIAELKQQIDLGHQTVNAADEVIAAFQGEVERLKAENETLRELYKGQR